MNLLTQAGSVFAGLFLAVSASAQGAPLQGADFPLQFFLPSQLGTQVPAVPPAPSPAINVEVAGPLSSNNQIIQVTTGNGQFSASLGLDANPSPNNAPNEVAITVQANRFTAVVPGDTTPVGLIAGTPPVPTPIKLSVLIPNNTGSTVRGSIRVLGNSFVTGTPVVSGSIDTGFGTVFNVPQNGIVETVLPIDVPPSGAEIALGDLQLQYPSGTTGSGFVDIRIRFEPYRFQSVEVVPTPGACSGGDLSNVFGGVFTRPAGDVAEKHEIVVSNGQPGATAFLAIASQQQQIGLPFPITACGLVPPIVLVPFAQPLRMDGSGEIDLEMPVGAIGPVYLQVLHQDLMSLQYRTTGVVQFVF